MIGLIAGIIGLIAAGCLVAYAVVMTLKWLKNQIKQRLAKKNVNKVVAADLQKLINDCENKMSLDEFEQLTEQGYTNLVANVDNDGQVSDLEIVKDTNNSIDEEVERLIGKNGMVVIER